MSPLLVIGKAFSIKIINIKLGFFHVYKCTLIRSVITYPCESSIAIPLNITLRSPKNLIY